MRASFLLILVITLFGSVTTYAQLVVRRAPKGTPPPRALLVTLLTRQNQRAYLEQYRPDLLPEFDHDVTEVLKRTVLDYSRYFRYCPVYFFIDSMSDKLAAGEWEGILLDAQLQPVSKPVIKPGDKDFFIAHYGSPIPQPDSVRPSNPGDLGSSAEKYGDDATALFREKLLVTDYSFRLLSRTGPRTNFSRVLRPAGFTGMAYRIYRRSITYNAKRWFIDYLPTAYSYDATLRAYFR